MNDLDFLVFTRLIKEAYLKCFGLAMKNPLTETESKLFCNKVLDQTGLSIGWKSVKNYSFFIIDAAAAKKENPSVATLDTLARYVLSAPYTNEIHRKNEESHYPYWFLYKEKFQHLPIKPVLKRRLSVSMWSVLAGVVLILLLIGYLKFLVPQKSAEFTDNFRKTDESTLLNNGWLIKAKDTTYWNRRNQTPGQLTLFTLKGDNWPDPSEKPVIKNLLLRPVSSDCFTAEVHLHDFIPNQEWQQAGILLLEDTTFKGKSVRLSLLFNDFFAGEARPKEIVVQAITCLGNGFGKPEEIAHQPVFFPDSAARNPLRMKNLENPGLRIEKHGKTFRFLFAGGILENGAFKEVVTRTFDMTPRYIGIFALKGFTNAGDMPVGFKFFRITSEACN